MFSKSVCVSSFVVVCIVKFFAVSSFVFDFYGFHSRRLKM